MDPFVLREANKPGTPELYDIEPWIGLIPALTAGITGRGGGFSPAPYQSLNMGLHVGDRAELVVQNRAATAEAVGAFLNSWTYGEQVHGCDVQVVQSCDAGVGTASREEAFQDKDAFITNQKGIVLGGLFADCVPLYFVDPINSAVGLAHAGWKGTVLRVAQRTIEAMKAKFGSSPDQLRAAIGPSIGSCCYEVDDAVIRRVEAAGLSGEPYYIPSNKGKYKLNLQEVNRQIMIEAGIMPYHIEVTKLCTGCRVDSFFSHRMEQGTTGRMAAWIGILDSK